MTPEPSTPPAAEADVFWGRCDPDNPMFGPDSPFKSPFSDKPTWREDNTCSYCGSMRPSIALKAIREGAEVEPTDKNYKIYVNGVNLPGCPANKCYLNHFSEAQALEFIRLHRTGQMKLAYPGHFYSGLCWARYKPAIEKLINELAANNQLAT